MPTRLQVIEKSQARPPSLLACVACRSKHLRCDANMPICARCQSRSLVCTYVESRRGYKGSRTIAGNHGKMFETGSTTTHADYAEAQSPYLSHRQDLTSASSSGLVYSVHGDVAAIPRNNQSNLMDGNSLIDLFYRSFFPAHPFLLPRKAVLRDPDILPESLKAVMRFVASQYSIGAPREPLQNAAIAIHSDNVSIDPGFKVQGLLCLSMVYLAGGVERNLGVKLLNESIDLALSAGMHHKDFAWNHAREDAILAESWRRTWWDLYIVDGLLSALDGSNHTSRLRLIHTDVPLPGHCEEYTECLEVSPSPNLQEMQDRVFSDSDYDWSSFSYKIEAMRIMGTVLQLNPDTFDITDLQVEAIDASISNYLISLPAHKRDVVEEDGGVDEVLFGAHMIIHWTSIILHRPRSTLTFIRNHYRTDCSKDGPIGIPALACSSHTAQALRAANAISNLTAVRTPLARHTPCFACAIALSATVHLPAYSLQSSSQDAQAIKERLRLSVSALAAISEVWPLAKTVKSQVAQFARETFQTPAVATASKSAIMVNASVGDIDLDSILNNDLWLDELYNSNGM